MSNRTSRVLVAGLAAAMVACGEDGGTSDLVARAGDYELTVQQVVDLIVDQEDLPMQSSVVQSLAELWVDYILLADAAADDSTFADLDFEGLVRPIVEQNMVLQLRDSVIDVDTAVADDELQAIYEADAPDLLLRARHILLTFPVQATNAQRDSVRSTLGDIRNRIVAGASFEEMARTYSQDPGTAAQGGDIGFFARGEMVAPFEEAVLELEPEGLSEVVETPLGLHLIRLEERRVQSFADVATDFRVAVQARRLASAESTFIADLESRSRPTLTDGALSVARELARAPDTRLSAGAIRRPLLEWDGGSYTAGEFLSLLRAEQTGLREEIVRRSDEELENFLLGQARGKLLIEEARVAGLEPASSTVDSLTAAARVQLREAVRSLGLLTPDRAPGEERDRAIARAVREALADNLSGATRIVPLGLVGFQLRESVPIAVYTGGMGQVLLRVAEARAVRGPSAIEESLNAPAQPADTVAR